MKKQKLITFMLVFIASILLGLIFTKVEATTNTQKPEIRSISIKGSNVLSQENPGDGNVCKIKFNINFVGGDIRHLVVCFYNKNTRETMNFIKEENSDYWRGSTSWIDYPNAPGEYQFNSAYYDPTDGNYTEPLSPITTPKNAKKLKIIVKPGKLYSRVSEADMTPNIRVEKQKTDSVTLKWELTTNTRYKVYCYDYKKPKKGYQYIGKVKNGNEYFKIKNLKAGTSYKVKVRPYVTVNGKNYYGPYSEALKISTQPQKLKITKIKSGNKKATIKWKKASGASGYQIYMSTSKNGKYKKVKTIKNAKTVSYTKKSLKNGQKYYFKVRAYKTVNGQKIYGSYSNPKSINL